MSILKEHIILGFFLIIDALQARHEEHHGFIILHRRTRFLGKNILGALLRETRDEYLVLIRSEKSKQIIERHVPSGCLDRITYVIGGVIIQMVRK